MAGYEVKPTYELPTDNACERRLLAELGPMKYVVSSLQPPCDRPAQVDIYHGSSKGERGPTQSELPCCATSFREALHNARPHQ